MTVIDWAENVNKNAYGQDSGFAENTETTEYKSGRRVVYLKNSRARKTHTIMLKFDDETVIENGLTEFQLFLDWFENTLASGANAFYFPTVWTRGQSITQENEKQDTAYYITEPPTWSGQRIKEVTLTLEEV